MKNKILLYKFNNKLPWTNTRMDASVQSRKCANNCVE